MLGSTPSVGIAVVAGRGAATPATLALRMSLAVKACSGRAKTPSTGSRKLARVAGVAPSRKVGASRSWQHGQRQLTRRRDGPELNLGLRPAPHVRSRTGLNLGATVGMRPQTATAHVVEAGRGQRGGPKGPKAMRQVRVRKMIGGFLCSATESHRTPPTSTACNCQRSVLVLLTSRRPCFRVRPVLQGP